MLTQKIRFVVRSMEPRRPGRRNVSSGFTLVEVLAAGAILVIAMLGSITAFNLIVQSLSGTEIRADQSRRIDQDVAAIGRLSEAYNACVDPSGSISTACTGVDVGNSFYYFPDPANADDRQDFYDACNSATAGSHITANFIAALNDATVLPAPGGDVTRQAAVRVAPGDPSNHLVEIRWVDPTRNNRLLRSIQITPLVSAWCP